uniref:Uncharacterized protein n=1 Tax=Electrophorus electricus TaxID=8005 RepID=A0A4W4DME1_ELEEL
LQTVKPFFVFLLSLMDMKPPISRAKMMSITKAGIKAIKLYKHVVQIIEKFIKRVYLARVGSVAEELCVWYGHHPATAGHGHSFPDTCAGEWQHAGRCRTALRTPT